MKKMKEQILTLKIDESILDLIKVRILTEFEKQRYRFLIILKNEIEKSNAKKIDFDIKELLRKYNAAVNKEYTVRNIYYLINKIFQEDTTYFTFLTSENLKNQHHKISEKLVLEIVAETKKEYDLEVFQNTKSSTDKKISYKSLYEKILPKYQISYSCFKNTLKEYKVTSDYKRRNRVKPNNKRNEKREQMFAEINVPIVNN